MNSRLYCLCLFSWLCFSFHTSELPWGREARGGSGGGGGDGDGLMNEAHSTHTKSNHNSSDAAGPEGSIFPAP